MIEKSDKGFGNESRFVSKFGDMDIAIMDTEEVTFKTKSSFGDVWTDLPLTSPESTCLSCTKSRYTLNDGREQVRVSAEFGDILLRKL